MLSPGLLPRVGAEALTLALAFWNPHLLPARLFSVNGIGGIWGPCRAGAALSGSASQPGAGEARQEGQQRMSGSV